MTSTETTSASRLWQEIVAATADLGPEGSVFRIPLFVEFRQPPRSLRERIGAAIGMCAPFFTLPRKAGEYSPRGRVLFCFPHRTNSNINNLLPVAREALRRGLLGGILTAPDLSAELHEFVGLAPIVSAEQLLGQLSVQERVRTVARAAKAYTQITEALSRHLDGFRLTGHRARLAREVVVSALYGSVCKRVLERWLPSCVISTSDFWPLEHQLCRQASRQQIPSLVIQHGVIDDFWWPFVADFYCMWGDAQADQMRRLGAPAERLTVLGMPAMDNLFGRANAGQYRSVGNRAQQVCLILSQTNGVSYEPEVFRSYREFLDGAINLMPSITWKVKLHPVEDDSFYRGMGEAVYRRLTFHPKRMSLEEAVNDADVVTTVFSTAGLESMIMDRPLIVAPAIPRVQELAWWPTMGGGTYASSAQEFQLQLTRLFLDQNHRARQLDKQRAFLSKSFANQGHAAERIVDLLEQYSDQLPASKTQSRLSAGMGKRPAAPSAQ
jgi:hypothetical protein